LFSTTGKADFIDAGRMFMSELLDFYRGKRVFITGHTGFKGAWLSQILVLAGAEVCGYALAPEPGNLFEQLQLNHDMHSVQGDIRELDHLQKSFRDFSPEIVLHLAAQPIVRTSYTDPVGTYATNVMGTVHLLECVRKSDCVRSVLNVTTDKVYQNREWFWGYRENERLDGEEPYANSKSCSELATGCYNRSFLKTQGVAVSTVRAGNAIGGGDYSKDRIIPDCVRAILKKEPVVLRCPNAVRPYQHVLELLSAYLLIAQAQYQNAELAGAYNAGPAPEDCVTTQRLAELFCRFWGEGAAYRVGQNSGPYESKLLRLDSSKIQDALGWHPLWRIERAVEKTVQWYRTAVDGDAQNVTKEQIKEFFEGSE